MEEPNAPINNADNSIPKVIANNLRVDAILGRGGMGTVYRATHTGLDRIVAVKVINPEFAANADITKRFEREAKLMAKLRHPRAAMIYDSGTLPDGRLFIVMEYVEGVTLAEVLKKQGRIPYKEAVEIAVNICDVLSEAHSHGIVHRDLKPANIMLNEQGVFVLDFGIAKMLNADSAETLKLSMTGGGALIGTPYYMSPEQCLGNPVEARSDLYSLGALLFEMLCGHPPFNEEIFSAIIIKHAMVEAPRLEEICADIPPALANVVNKLLAKKPEDRPASAAATRRLLEASVSGETAPLANFVTQTGASSEAAVTKILPSQTNPQMPKPATTLPGGDRGKSARPVLIAAGVAALLLVVAAVGIGTYIFVKTRSNVIASNTPANDSYANSMANMHQSNHTMTMGDDFAMNANSDKTNAPSMPILSAEEADKVITMITQTTEHRADGMLIVKTPKDTALVCLHNMIDMGKTHIFAVERPNPNSQWEITARVSLDTPDFHGANWTFEPQDVDGDGYEEVIFNSATADNAARRCLIYSPRTRQNYWITAAKDANGKITKTVFSPNAETPNSKAFRAALEQNVQSR